VAYTGATAIAADERDQVMPHQALRNAVNKAIANGAPIVTEQRPLYAIAREIRADWKKPYFGAVPYLDAMGSLENICGMYGQDDARSIVLYFLSNASSWRGPVAKRVKAELKALAGVK
jgi:hypothetical protein